MKDLAATICANAETLVHLNARIHATFQLRSRSNADLAEWRNACAAFHQRYSELFFPGGMKHWEAFVARDPTELESAISFLEVDPWFFRSGYLKQIIWSRLKTCPLTDHQLDRIEAVALAYLRKRVYKEFWYMVRFARARGTRSFWSRVAAEAATDESAVGNKAGWLMLARENHPVKNWVGRECRRAQYFQAHAPNLCFHRAAHAA